MGRVLWPEEPESPETEMNLLWSSLGKAQGRVEPCRVGDGGERSLKLLPGEVGESKWLMFKEDAWSSFPLNSPVDFLYRKMQVWMFSLYYYRSVLFYVED